MSLLQSNRPASRRLHRRSVASVAGRPCPVRPDAVTTAAPQRLVGLAEEVVREAGMLELLAAEMRIAELEAALEEARSAAFTDPLTGALNRRGLEEQLAIATGKTNATFSVALLDLDHFSQINTAHGHAGGDQALRHLVATAQARLGSHGQIARLGGDEFVLILPGMPQAQTEAQLRRLQELMAQRPFLHGDQRVHVHFSAGVAQWRAGESADALLKRADQALYAAKQAGRDRVGVAQ